MIGTSESYYRSLGAGRYQPSKHVQGAWNDDEQHLAPLIGLVIHEAMQTHQRPELHCARISVEVLGFLPLAQTQIETVVIRAGRTIELTESVATVADRAVLRVRIWQLVVSDTTAQVSQESAPMSPVDSWPVTDFGWDGGFIKSIQTRIDPQTRPGRGRGWIHSPHRLVDTGEVSQLAQLLALADTTNGLSPALDPQSWLFPNVDLSCHLLRYPTGDWLGLDVSHEIGPSGVGIASAILHDGDGPFARLAQILTVRRR